jgi:hypothetical protein
MTYRLPFPLPGQYDPSGPFNNPGGTNPLPAPGNIPTPCWFGAALNLNWVASGVVGINLTSSWASPIFDMRPDIRGLSPNNAGGFTRVAQGAAGARSMMAGVPMWNPSAQLWVQLSNPINQFGLLGGNLLGFEILATEQVHISNPQNLQTVSPAQDITEEFTTMGESSILGWTPVGDGRPARFYRLQLTFNIKANFGAAATGPQMTLESAMY